LASAGGITNDLRELIRFLIMSMRTRIFASLAVVVASACFVYWMQRNVPSEAYRFRHPQGYSVCRPKDWSADVIYSQSGEQLGNAPLADGLALTPDHFTGIPPKLFVNRFASAPDPQMLRSDGWTDGIFQGQPALVREKKLTKALSRGAVFQRAGQWFEVVEGLSVPGSVQKEEWWQFLETFRYPDGEPLPAKPVPLAPASAPSSTQPFQFPAIGT
jgi:hypothetical protein